MAKDSNAPGSCVDCGNDAYIHLAGESSGDMVCAHCYVARRDAAKPLAGGVKTRVSPQPSH